MKSCHFQTKPLVAAIFATFLFGTPKVYADEMTAVAADDSQKLADIVVQGERQAPAHSTVHLDEQHIQRHRGVSVADFLEGQAGVMSSNKRNSGSLAVNIRGTQDENRVPVLVDGALQSIPSWQGYAGSSTRSFLDPDLLESASIDKGPTMAADATGAVGGMVRAQTLSANSIIKEGRDWGFRVRLGTMSNSTDEPALYTRGGLQTRWVESCQTNGTGLCREGSGQPEARYASSLPRFHAFHGSLAFAKRWQNADVVLAYAQRRQGNYFVGKHGPAPTPLTPDFETDEWLTVHGAQDPSQFWTAAQLANCAHSYNLPHYQRCYEEATVGEVADYADLPRGATLYRAGEAVLNTAHRNRSYLAKFNYYHEQHQLGIAYRRYESRFGELMPSMMGGRRGDGSLQGEGSEITVDSIGTNYRYRPDNPWINLQVATYATRSHGANFTPMIEDYGHDMSGRFAYFTLSKQTGFNINNTSQFKLLQRPFTLSAGINYQYERIEQPNDALRRVREKNYPDDAIMPLYIRDALRREFSAFINGRWQFAPQWQLEAGLRHIRTRIDDHRPWVDGTGNPSNIYHPPTRTRGTAPIVALSYQANDNSQIYLRYAGGVRAPSLFQASKGFSTSHFDRDPHPLAAERAHNWELGGHWQWQIAKQHQLKLQVAYFDNRIKDYLTRIRVIHPTRPSTIQTSNIHSVRFRGFEAGLQWDSPNWYGRLSWTHYLSSRFCLKPEQVESGNPRCVAGNISQSNIGNHVPPKDSVSATLGSRWLNGKLDIGARYTFHSSRLVPAMFKPEGAQIQSLPWKAYGIVDLYGHYQVSDDLSFSVGIDNVGNRYYLDANNMSLTPAPGRTVHLKMDWRF